jgi:hypothetical protein
MRFPWHIVLICGAVVAVFGLRLGYKTVTLSDTQIIDHYAKAFLSTMAVSSAVADSSDCYAIAGQSRWERMRVVCSISDHQAWSYRIGWWGQLLSGRPELVEVTQ